MWYVLLYKIILDAVYPTVNKFFLYAWGNSMDFNFIKYIESFLLFIILIKFILNLKSKIVKELLNILIGLNFIPMTTIYSFLNEERSVIYLYFFSYLIIISIYYIFFRVKNKVLFKNKEKIQKKIKFICILLSVLTCFYLIIKFGKPEIAKAFHYKKLYELREKNKLRGIFKYLFYIYIYLGTPLMIVKLKRGTKHFFVIGTIVALYVYIPKKIIFAYIVIFYISYFFSEKIRISKVLYFCYSIFLMIGLITKKILIIGTCDRVFYLPAYLSFVYNNFFKNRNYNLFWGSKLSLFFPNNNNDYGIYTYYISNVVFGSNMNANANFIASSYAEGGILVVVIVSAILGWIFSFIHRAYLKGNLLEKKLIYMLSIPNILILTNGPLWTIFLTNGFLVVLIVFWIIIYSKGEKNIEICKKYY